MYQGLLHAFRRVGRFAAERLTEQLNPMDGLVVLCATAWIGTGVLWWGNGTPFFGIRGLAWLWLAIAASPGVYLFKDLPPALVRLGSETLRRMPST